MLEQLHEEGTHEIVLTVMTLNSGDLLAANLNTTKAHKTLKHIDDEHHHIPWLEVFLALIVFIGGFLLGRFNKEKKS